MKNQNFKDVIYTIIEAWGDVPVTRMHFAWWKLLPHIMKDFIVIEFAPQWIQCITLAMQAAFDEVEGKYFELMECHDNDDMIPNKLKLFTDSLALIKMWVMMMRATLMKKQHSVNWQRTFCKTVLQKLKKLFKNLKIMTIIQSALGVKKIVGQDFSCYYQPFQDNQILNVNKDWST